MFTKNPFHPTPTYEAKVAVLKAMQAELKSYAGIMTPYEKMTVEGEIQKKRSEYYPEITSALAKKFDLAAAKYKDARAAVTAAKAKEINRWDVEKLSASTRRYSDQIERLSKMQPDPMAKFYPADEIEKLLQEAKESNDIHKMRGVSEIISTMPNLPGATAKMAVIKREAKEMLKQLRESEEVAAALQLQELAFTGIGEIKSEIVEVAGLFPGEDVSGSFFANGTFARMLNRIKVDVNGEVNILDANDPALGGIDWSTMPPEGWKPA